MRGKDDGMGIRVNLDGITPAYAGKSPNVEKLAIWYLGSPPPMRGKAIKNGGFIAEERITPAYAGKSPDS